MECDICQKKWNPEDIIPRILPCGHTFCQSCLVQIVEKFSGEEFLKCPTCEKELKSIMVKNDILNLRKNTTLLMITDKLETQKSKFNLSSLSLSSSLKMNSTINAFNNSNEEKPPITQDALFKICPVHKSKANFYMKKEENMVYICNECLRTMPFEGLKPLPNLKTQNEFLISSCKNKINFLKDELSRVEKFLKNYVNDFEVNNKKK